MANILQSASKIVFILLTITACVGFFMKILDPKDFMLLASMAYGFYFASKPTDSNAGMGIK
jgi:predicted membrane channel-forming protein YqfA (hemolysin III family)